MPKRYEVENLTRDVILLQIPPHEGKGPKVWKDEVFKLGDKNDTDDKVPETGRNEKLQPKPRVELTEEQFKALGERNIAVLEEWKKTKPPRVRITELAS